MLYGTILNRNFSFLIKWHGPSRLPNAQIDRKRGLVCGRRIGDWRLKNPREASSRPASTSLHEPQLVKGNARWLNQKSQRAKAKSQARSTQIVHYYLFVWVAYQLEP